MYFFWKPLKPPGILTKHLSYHPPLDKLSHENTIKREKRPPRYFDNPKYPLKRIEPKPQRSPLDIQLLCIYAHGFSMLVFRDTELWNLWVVIFSDKMAGVHRTRRAWSQSSFRNSSSMTLKKKFEKITAKDAARLLTSQTLESRSLSDFQRFKNNWFHLILDQV